MRVEIYGDAATNTVSGDTVQFTADDAIPVKSLEAQITPSIAGNQSVTITANGQTTEVSLEKTVYGGGVNVTTGLVTETHGGGAYDPSAVPADLASKIRSATTERSASGEVAAFSCTLGEFPMSAVSTTLTPTQNLHGYGKPWPGGGGKNLWSADIPYKTGAGIYSDSAGAQITAGSDAAVSVTKDGNDIVATTTTGWKFATFIVDNLSSGDYTLSFQIDETQWSGTQDGIDIAVIDADYIIVRKELHAAGFLSSYELHITLSDGESGIAISLGGRSSTFGTLVIRGLQLELGSTATAWTPYENICPITGHDSVRVWVQPTHDTTADPAATVQLGQTVYGGTIDVVSGEMVLDTAAFDITASTAFSGGGATKIYTNLRNMRRVTDYRDYMLSSLLPVASDSNAPVDSISVTGYVYDTTYPGDNWLYLLAPTGRFETREDFVAWVAEHPFRVCYPLATPITIQLTPTKISTILGQNRVWSDGGGETSVTYRDGSLSNVSNIMTNSTALTTGENITYTLSQQRTYQIPGTVIRTVEGNNVMSANTGKITVTWSSPWFDITPWIAYQGLTFSRNDVDAPDAGRDMSGYMHRGRVGVKEKMNITTVQLTRAQSSILQTLLYPETIQVRVTPYPRTNAAHTMSMYTNNVKTTYVIHRANGEDLQSLTFPLIEN